MKSMFLMVLIALAGLIALDRQSTVEELRVVVCHYAVITDTGTHDDPAIIQHILHKDDVEAFVSHQRELNQADKLDTPACWGHVDRELIRIRMSEAVLQPDLNNPEIKTLIGKPNPRILWVPSMEL